MHVNPLSHCSPHDDRMAKWNYFTFIARYLTFVFSMRIRVTKMKKKRKKKRKQRHSIILCRKLPGPGPQNYFRITKVGPDVVNCLLTTRKFLQIHYLDEITCLQTEYFLKIIFHNFGSFTLPSCSDALWTVESNSRVDCSAVVYWPRHK